MKTTKFTFKTEKAKGKWKAFDDDSHYIKLDKKEVGNISDDFNHTIRFMVEKKDINEDKNPNCTWKWITFKYTFKTLEKAKLWLNENCERILKEYTLHQLD